MVTMVEQPLQRTSPEQQGLSSSALLQFVEAVDSQLHELHSFMLLRHGRVVAEGWWSPYQRETPHMLFSLSKSFTSTAVGLAVNEGRFSIDDPVISFFPDETPAEVSDFLAAMRVRHLLSMSTGQAQDTMPYMGTREDGRWTKGFFNAPVLHEPGTHFVYNTGATYMLSAIVQKTTGLKLLDYLQSRLFEPLGIRNATWQESPEGIHTGGFGMNARTEDIARFGQLYLQKGMWEDRRILPEAWVEEATSRQVSNGEGETSDWTQGYGYQFWRCRHDAYRGDGAFGQYCIVMPEQDAVLAITGGIADMQIPLNLVWDILLPAMERRALPDDTSAHEKLTQKLSSLAFLPVQGTISAPISAKVSNQTYSVDTNELKIESVTLNFAGSQCTVTIKASRGEESIPCSYGGWLRGQTALFNAPWEPAPAPIVASGAWTGEDTFTTIVRFYETPFYDTMVYHFTEDELIIETRVNVGFEPPKTLRFTAHPIRE
jgi:CubicO group peptidase (beta-lactamase class C family)